MTECIRDAYKAGGKGAVADYRLEAKPWKGDYVAALAALDNVEMWHGDEDKTVPFAAGCTFSRRSRRRRSTR